MFELYFGKFLLGKNKISQSQYEYIMNEHQNAHVKLGLIAIAENLLTINQANKINQLQKEMDKRFGDIAIEKGYLILEELNYLLDLQQNSYSKMIQLLVDNDILTMDEIKLSLNEFQRDNNFTDNELEHIKSGDIDRIFSVFVNINNNFINELAALIVRTLSRFIDRNIRLGKSYITRSYAFENLASQRLVGSKDIFIGLTGRDKSLLAIANTYANEDFTEVDEDAFDSVNEFINCSSGLFASKLSLEGIEIDMTPPQDYENQRITSGKDFYIIPLYIKNNHIDLILSIDNDLNIN